MGFWVEFTKIGTNEHHFTFHCYLPGMLIEERSLKHWIENFYGYGSWESKFWFIGHEEGGGNLPEEVVDKLNYFAKFHPSAAQPALCDLRDLYRHVAFRDEGPKSEIFKTRFEYRFENNAVQNNIWKNLSAFAHGYENKALPDLLEYQKNNFAISATQKEALIQLYPLPSPHNHAWYYSWLEAPGLPFLKSRKLYEDALYEKRISTILQLLKKHKPEVVLLYGMNNINTLKQSVAEFFPGAKFQMIKQIKLQIPQHHRAEIDGTKVLITTQLPALRHNRIETGFDWELFAREITKSS
jgi:hypothetical protein